MKDATDLVRLVGEHVTLKPKGREFVGLCPFHDDHTPSFAVVPHKQFYKCFSCGAAGDCFTFVQKFLKMEFGESLQFLADRAGVTLTRREGARTGEAEGLSKPALFSANERACEFFRAVMKHPEHGALGRSVIEKRGISQGMIDEFRLGVAPDRWDGLVLAASKLGIDAATLAGSGLVKQRESGGVYDAFRNRVMFPICDRTGRPIAFGARKIRDEDEPKYLNSPETRLFNKSATLYALHMALRPMQETRTAIICEGYTDVIACHQAGFRNAVATLGTALTPLHSRELRLACDRVVLLFDGDEAGQRAADRAAEVFFAEPLDVCVVTLDKFTDAKDPDELLKREDGKETFKRALAGAEDVLAYRFTRVRERVRGSGLSALGKAVNEELARLAELGLSEVEPLRRALIVRSLAGIAGVSEDAVKAAIPAGRGARQVSTRAAQAAEQSDAERTAESEILKRHLSMGVLSAPEHVLSCLLCDGTLWGALTDEDKDAIAPGVYRFEALRRVAQSAHDAGEDSGTPELEQVLKLLADDGDAKEAAIQLMSREYAVSEAKGDRTRQTFLSCVAQLRREALRARVEVKPGALDAAGVQERVEATREATRQHGAPLWRKVPRPPGG